MLNTLHGYHFVLMLFCSSFRENVAKRFQAFRQGATSNSYDTCSVEYTESTIVFMKEVANAKEDEEFDSCESSQGTDKYSNRCVSAGLFLNAELFFSYV